MTRENLFQDEITQNEANSSDQRLGDEFMADDFNEDDLNLKNDNQLGEDADGDIYSGEENEEDVSGFDFEEGQLGGEEDDNFYQDEEDDYKEPAKPIQKTNEPVKEIELDSLNKTLGTNFKTLEEAKQSFKTDISPQLEESISEDQIQTYDKNSKMIDYFKKSLSGEPKDLVYESLKAKYRAANNNEFDDYAKNEIDNKIEVMESNGTLDLNADNIRNKVENAIDRLLGENRTIDSKRNEIAQNKQNKLRDTLQGHFTTHMQQGKFYGATLEKEKVRAAYESITSGEIFKEIENNPQFVTELALFRQYKDVISEMSKKPGYSDGVKDIFAEIKGNNPKDVKTAQVRRTHGNNGSNDLKSRFLS